MKFSHGILMHLCGLQCKILEHFGGLLLLCCLKCTISEGSIAQVFRETVLVGNLGPVL